MERKRKRVRPAPVQYTYEEEVLTPEEAKAKAENTRRRSTFAARRKLDDVVSELRVVATIGDFPPDVQGRLAAVILDVQALQRDLK